MVAMAESKSSINRLNCGGQLSDSNTQSSNNCVIEHDTARGFEIGEISVKTEPLSYVMSFADAGNISDEALAQMVVSAEFTDQLKSSKQYNDCPNASVINPELLECGVKDESDRNTFLQVDPKYTPTGDQCTTPGGQCTPPYERYTSNCTNNLKTRTKSDNKFKTEDTLKTHTAEQTSDKHVCAEDDCCRSFKNQQECSKVLKTKTALKIPKESHETTVIGQQCADKSCARRSYPDHKCCLHKTPKTYKCQKCPKMFRHNSNMIRHRSVHKTNRQFVCLEESCHKSFKTCATLKCHAATHSNERPFICPEEGCGKKFKTISSFSSHKASHREFEEFQTTKCLQCDKVFKSNKRMERHMKLIHQERKYKCSECNKMFRTNSHLNDHIIYIHRGDAGKKFQCVECDKMFKTKQRLTKHAAVHKENEFPCSVCNNLFKYKQSLKRHMLQHGPRPEPYVCVEPGCNKRFKDHCVLKRHMLVHSKDRPFMCDVEGCKKAFKTSGCLARHKPIHSEIKGLQCSECDNFFKTRDRLYHHEKVHSKPSYKCPTCDKMFKTNSNLNVHKLVHMKKH